VEAAFDGDKTKGVQVHDARLAALMNAYRIKRILTLNPTDFARYSDVNAVTPHEVVSPKPQMRT
jgi:predicted nucleic acid-binding protein